MFTVEFESDASVITTIDERDRFEDVQMILGDDGTVYIRQFEHDLEQYQMLYMSSQQWLDLLTAYQSPEGAYYVKVVTQ